MLFSTLRRILTLALLAAGLSTAALAVPDVSVAASEASAPVRILTFNVRCSTARDGENAWSKRRDFLADVITKYPDGNGPYDFVGTQETVIHPNPELNQNAFLIKNLGKEGYGNLGRSREKNVAQGESMTLFWKTARWRLDPAEQGTFWLSETPDVPGSKIAGAGCTRSVTFGLFHEISKAGTDTGRRIYVYNTHYDHVGHDARIRGAEVLAKHVAARKDKAAPVVVMGDLNAAEQSPPIRYMRGESITHKDAQMKSPVTFTDTFRAANPDAKDVGTFTGFRKPHKDKIDYIFITPPLKTVSAQIIRTQRDGRFPSDHFPVEAVVSWSYVSTHFF